MELNEVAASELQSIPPKITPRGYQLECLSKARERNVIICLETGCGKTLIAAELLKELSSQFSSSIPCIAIFLVPTVMLVQQQANAIVDYVDLKVGQYNGQHEDKSKWDSKKWETNIRDLEVLVMTPQILLNILHHAFIKLEAIKVLVFDECHHCQKGHPYAQIMEEYYFKAELSKRPKILGMTASPVIRKGKSEFQCTQDINSLESLLNAKIVTVEDRNDLEAVVPSPCIEIKIYDRVYGSFDKLQSVMGMIHQVKAKQAGFEEISLCHRRRQSEGLERICRDLEYCIYDLGLWCARYAAKKIFSKEDNFVIERPEAAHEATSNIKKEMFLTDVCELLNQAVLQGGYVEDLEVENLKSDFISNKVASLVEVLLNSRFNQLKCIIFVERVVAAKVLACFLSKILKSVRCDYIVGHQSKNGSSSKSHMSKTISNFCSGTVNLLVATNVAEEGLDIQNCSLVIHFDMPKTLRSFIQSRGRARVQFSHYVILKDRRNISEETLLDNLFHSESFVKEKISQGTLPSTNASQREDFDSYEVESTGAIVNTHSSVQLLYRYCSKLPSDEFYQPQPSFQYIKEQDGVKCSITLPSNACLRLVEGEMCDSETTAKKAACLKACKILHLKGALTDYLLPQTTTTVKEDIETASHSSVVKASTEELQETVTPSVWLLQPTSSSSMTCLQAYRISFDANPSDREYVSFVLLLQSPLPKEAANFCETLKLRHGKAVLCKLEPVQNVFLDHFQIAQAEQFQSRLFSVLLDRDLDHSRSKEPPISDGSWYLLLPLKQNNSNKEPEIDWKRIFKLRRFQELNYTFCMTELDCHKPDTDVLKLSNGVIRIEDLPGLLVKTLDGKNLYCIIDKFTDLRAESPFPNGRYKTYVDYFKTMYDRDIVLKGQHLLKARFLREAHNFLLARSRENDHGSKVTLERMTETEKSSMELERSIVELPPELCRIEFSGFYDDFINAAVILPSLLHKLESILLATQFRKFLSSQFPEGSQVSIEKVLEALTTEKCLDSFSLERLELLGDSFLKYAVGRYLFLMHEEVDEGFLSMQRMQRISNSSLFTLGSKLGLAGYIRDTLFDPKQWVAPCHPCKAACDDSKLEDLHGKCSDSKEGKASVTCSKRHRWMQRKTVADVVEALIGAYLEDGGENAALAFMGFIGIKVAIDVSQIVKVQSLSENNLSLVKKIDIEAIEKLLSYRFNHKGLLLEALTHASCTNHLGKCYQRLEFLGDSVLDFLITKHLYRKFKDSKPGELTDLRSTIVSNESFARITIQHKLYAYLIENSVELRKGIRQFLTHVFATSEQEHVGDWKGDKCSKVLADILESLSGAICVDGGFDLSLVWEVFEPILGPSISSRLVRLHPVRELQEVCQKNRLTWTRNLSPMSGRQCHYTYKICVGKIVVEGTAVYKDKHSAKRLAALEALEKLKVLGYVHACKGESPASQKAKRRDAKVVKDAINKLKLSDSPQTMSPCTPMLPTTSNIAGSSTPLPSTMMNTSAGCSSHHIQDHTLSDISLCETVHSSWEFGDKNEAQFREGPFDTLAKELSVETLGASNVDIEPQLRASSSATLATEPSDKLKMGHTHLRDKSPSMPSSSNAMSDDILAPGVGSSINHFRDHLAGGSAMSEKFERLGISEPQFRVEMTTEGNDTAALAGHQVQTFSCLENYTESLKDQQIRMPSLSSMVTSSTQETRPESVAGMQGGYLQHSNMLMENVWQRAWLVKTNGVGNSNAADFHIIPSIPAYITTDDTTTDAASRGIARSSLHEACARKRWKPPSFSCAHEEGPPHDKWFTYEAILQLPDVGQVECRGDPRKTSKAAMDSAAAELLIWLRDSGYL